MGRKTPGFENVSGEIRFASYFNDLFDVFNSKSENHRNILKRSLCPENCEKTFELFDKSINYIKGLRLVNENTGEVKSILGSRVQTGFNGNSVKKIPDVNCLRPMGILPSISFLSILIGFINNMNVVKLIYEEYVENRQIMRSIPLYWLGQDPLEIFFGRCRALNGFNDNPNAQQFSAAFRKLLAFDTILSSKASNCTEDHTPARPFANILYVSSAKLKDESTGEVSFAQLENLYQKLSEIEYMEQNSLFDSAMDYGIAVIAAHIEHRIMQTSKIYCEPCKDVFKQNEKMQSCSGFAIAIECVPCRSTFQICKEANRFLKLCS